jgi:SAM-dependent methyltransferase
MTLSGDRKPESSRSESMWDRYARFYVLEEGTIYPEDRKEMDFYRQLRVSLVGDCLELGAGAGRLARSLLHDSGLTVALEPSAAMMGLWSRQDQGLADRVQGRAESIPFADGSFDLVIFPYNGLQCILQPQNRLLALRETRRVLRRGGRFVLEICPLFATRPLEQDAHRYTFVDDSISVTLVESISRDRDRGITTYDMLYSVEGEPDTRVVLDVAILEPGDLVRMLQSSGFRVEHEWGGYDMRDYEHGLSPRFIAQATLSDAS